jgi:sulfur-carrier protein
MKIRIRFLLTFRELFNGKVHDIDLPHEQTLGELLRQLADTEEKKQALFKGKALRSSTVVIKNGLSARSNEDMNSKLKEGDSISIFPLMGGG